MRRFDVIIRESIEAMSCLSRFAVAQFVLVTVTPANVFAGEGRTGKEIYVRLCAECHGANGEGVADKHDETLYGNRPLSELVKIINDTMPEGQPEKCTGEDAEKVAAYIYETFYTAEARARNKPPRIELSRLTVRQYENAVADLLAPFRGLSRWDDQRGLRGVYYNARNFKRDKKVFERVDPKIEFSFGEGSPDAEKLGAEEFSMRWEGSLIAEESGEYEFAIRSENGVRLWVNNNETPLIDAWVSSRGDPREETATIRLPAGRAYPLKLDFFKFKDKSASLVLRWKPPHGVWDTIPNGNLHPRMVPETLVIATAFPADDSSVGYARGTAVSKDWDKAATDAAIEVANTIVADLDDLAKTKTDASDRKERVKEFCYRLVERAFRRPLTEEQKKFFVDARLDEAADLDSGVKRVVVLALKSPRFLYPEIGEPAVDDYDVASRLSFALWDTLPDEELLKAAAAGRLRSQEEVAAQAQRMLADPRAKAKLQGFFHDWLPFDEAEEISKDTEAFPGFDEALVNDLRTSLELFIDEIVWSESSDYRRLLLADYWYVNERIARFYGLDTKPAEQNPPAEPGAAGATASVGEGFQKVTFDPKERTGLVTHPFLLSALAYHKSSSPIHRGVFATRKLLGRALKPPPMAIQFMDGSFDPHMTMREKVAELTKSANCQTCHSVINPLGFSLEQYDAVGRFRTMDKERPVDAGADYPSPTGEVVRLTGARDLAELAAKSDEAHKAFVEQMFHHLVKQPAQAYGPETLTNLTRSFAESGYNIQRLVVEIAAVGARHGVSQ